MLTLFQPLAEEPLVAQERRETRAQLARVAHVVRIETRRVDPATREPREHDRREGGSFNASPQPRTKDPHDALRVDREIGAVATRPLNRALAVDARPHE